MKSKNQIVVITGMGIVSSTGQGISIFRDALFHGLSYFTRSLSYPMLSFPVLGAYITNFNFSQALTNLTIPSERQMTLKKIARSLPSPLQIAMIAAMEAWQQAAIDLHPKNMTRIGLVAAAQNSTGNYQYDLTAAFKQQPDYLSPTFALNFMDTNYIGVLSEIFGILGEGFSVGGASATGNVALLHAYQMIHAGRQDGCLVIGAMADLSPMELQGFYNLGAMGGHRFADQPEKACRPFDKDHDGFIYGQAAAGLFLESLASAEKRQIPILGYLQGGALILDGNRLSNPQLAGEIRVMREAMKVAGITANDLDYINAHGTSAPLGDEVEIEAIEAILGERSRQVIINSTKSITGHCLWSAGIVEAIATIIQMQGGFVHPTLNLDDPISKKSLFAREKSANFPIQIALNNSFGFGGINTSIVLSKENLSSLG